jgi:release factor glutamine methyltransferase
MKRWIKESSKNRTYTEFARVLKKIENKKPAKRHITVLNHSFEQYADVFPADTFGDTEFFTSEINVVPDEHFLEIGIGTGVTAIIMATQGANVVGVDISERAVENAKINAKQNIVEEKAIFFVSDVFSKVPQQTFDTIYWNVPFCYSEIKELSYLQKSIFDYQYNSLATFFKESQSFLKQNGRLLVGFSNVLGLPEKLLQFAYDSDFTKIKIIKQKMVEWESLKYDLTLYEFKNK